jgi:hypothetical protein
MQAKEEVEIGKNKMKFAITGHTITIIKNNFLKFLFRDQILLLIVIKTITK